VPPRKGISLDPLQIALGEKYRIEVPVFPLAAGSARLLRISAHLYNRATDYERLIEALRAEEIALADG
jgi:isopenicillin-N epimerase